jgi:hypothetical protein
VTSFCATFTVKSWASRYRVAGNEVRLKDLSVLAISAATAAAVGLVANANGTVGAIVGMFFFLASACFWGRLFAGTPLKTLWLLLATMAIAGLPIVPKSDGAVFLCILVAVLLGIEEMMQRSSNWRAPLTLLLIAAIGIAPANGQTISAPPIILVYSATQTSHATSTLMKSPRGVMYRLSLIPDSDVGMGVLGLNLVLHRPSEQATFYGNLLDPTGMLHGYQPYTFGAFDYINGAKKSEYGATRVMKLRKLGMEMRVTVTRVRVVPSAGDFARNPEYKFHDLTLEITTRAL